MYTAWCEAAETYLLGRSELDQQKQEMKTRVQALANHIYNVLPGRYDTMARDKILEYRAA